MAEEQEQAQVVFNGFHQGSSMEGGALGPVRSYIALKNTGTDRVLNIEITDEDLKRVIMLSRNGAEGEASVGADIVHPSLDVDPGGAEEATDTSPPPLQEEPTPESAFPGEE